MLSSLNVSSEIIEKLKIYEALLKKWQPHINLVSGSTLNDIWNRHFLDSAQLFDLISERDSKICDLGSGAGFPGAVLAILGCSNVTLIERDYRKCSFLRSVSRETEIQFEVFEGEIKDYPYQADFIISRALAPLNDLLIISKLLIKPKTKCLFLKGRQVDRELKEIDSKIRMTVLKKQSIVSKEGVVLELTDIVFK